MAPSPAGAQTPEELFAALRATDSARPLVTFYDRATGERAELSTASLGNWVAKTHFLLIDELGLGRGDAAFVDLPVHWLTLPVWFGVFSAGLTLTSDPSAASVAFVDVDVLSLASALPSSLSAVPELFAVPLLPWGRAFDVAPTGAGDYVAAVRPQADAWGSVRRTGAPDDRAADGFTRAELMAAARSRAVDLGLAEGARMLLTDRGRRSLALVDVLAALSVNGSLVLLRNAGAASQPDTDDALIAQERVTNTG